MSKIIQLKNKKTKQSSSVKIIGLVGLAGSGKSQAVEHLKGKNYPHVYFGGIIFQVMKERGIEVNSANEKKMRAELREEFGDDFLVLEIIRRIENLIAAGQKRIIADGIYSWTEYKILKKRFPRELKVIAMVPPKHLRHKRIGSRSHRPFTLEEVNARDYDEIENLEKGGPIAMADFFIVNDGSVAKSRRKLDKILQEIDF